MPMPISSAMMLFLMTVFAIMVAIAWYDFIVVPAFLHKIDRPATGIVSATVFGPVVSVARWNDQIHRGLNNSDLLYDSWLTVNEPWLLKVAHIEAAIKARLSKLY
ncbi:hypothetical protein VN23_10810 [Janthinobacterium sp. B9-8]|nr:hypothetical protein VN23_10810 [Janthinobacterium sp. B9-8]